VLTIHLAKAETSDKGKVRIKTLTLADKLLISQAEVALARAAGRPRTEQELARLDNPFQFLDDAQM
jgi:hypothetical protein